MVGTREDLNNLPAGEPAMAIATEDGSAFYWDGRRVYQLSGQPEDDQSAPVSWGAVRAAFEAEGWPAPVLDELELLGLEPPVLRTALRRMHEQALRDCEDPKAELKEDIYFGMALALADALEWPK